MILRWVVTMSKNENQSKASTCDPVISCAGLSLQIVGITIKNRYEPFYTTNRKSWEIYSLVDLWCLSSLLISSSLPPVTSLDLVNFLFALVWPKDDKSLIVGSINDKMMNLKEKHMTRPMVASFCRQIIISYNFIQVFLASCRLFFL